MGAQKEAILISKVKLTGHRPESIIKVYEKAAPRSRVQINPRTGKPFTIFGELSEIVGEKHDFTAYLEVERDGILGNFPNDITEFFHRAASRLNVRVSAELIRTQRKQT